MSNNTDQASTEGTASSTSSVGSQEDRALNFVKMLLEKMQMDADATFPPDDGESGEDEIRIEIEGPGRRPSNRQARLGSRSDPIPHHANRASPGRSAQAHRSRRRRLSREARRSARRNGAEASPAESPKKESHHLRSHVRARSPRSAHGPQRHHGSPHRESWRGSGSACSDYPG